MKGLNSYLFNGLADDERKNFIYEGQDAINAFIALTMPPLSSPVKSLKELKNYSNHLLDIYTQPYGELISSNSISDIIEYLNQKYNFSQKIFNRNTPIFTILNISHRYYNSECLITSSPNGSSYHFFLYCMKKDSNGANPQYVLFHELGHAIHSRYTGNTDIIPTDVIDFLKNLCMPTIDSITSQQQAEVIADIFAMGLMFNSPYAEFDPFIPIESEDKKQFKMLTEKIMLSL